MPPVLNSSFATGSFTSAFNHAITSPLKKSSPLTPLPSITTTLSLLCLAAKLLKEPRMLTASNSPLPFRFHILSPPTLHWNVSSRSPVNTMLLHPMVKSQSLRDLAQISIICHHWSLCSNTFCTWLLGRQSPSFLLPHQRAFLVTSTSRCWSALGSVLGLFSSLTHFLGNLIQSQKSKTQKGLGFLWNPDSDTHLPNATSF